MSRDEMLSGHRYDTIAGARVVIESPHERVHAGHSFNFSKYDAGVTNGGTLIVRINTPTSTSGYFHLIYNFSSKDYGTVEFMEGGTASGGTTATVWNNNRNSADSPGLDVVVNPTSLTGSSVFFTCIVGSGVGPFAAGAHKDWTKELVLAPNSSYFFRFTSQGASNSACICFDAYRTGV